MTAAILHREQILIKASKKNMLERGEAEQDALSNDISSLIKGRGNLFVKFNYKPVSRLIPAFLYLTLIS